MMHNIDQKVEMITQSKYTPHVVLSWHYGYS